MQQTRKPRGVHKYRNAGLAKRARCVSSQCSASSPREEMRSKNQFKVSRLVRVSATKLNIGRVGVGCVAVN